MRWSRRILFVLRWTLFVVAQMTNFTLDTGGHSGHTGWLDKTECRFKIARTSAGMAGPRRKSYDCDDNRDTRG